MATRKKAQPASAEKSKESCIVDPATGLEWSQTLAERMTWNNAKNAAADYRGGGHDDWRLPDIKELIGIVDYSRFNPAVNTDLFPDTKSSWYWSATADASSPADFAWLVVFYDGGVDFGNQYGVAFVRLVRGPRASQ